MSPLTSDVGVDWGHDECTMCDPSMKVSCEVGGAECLVIRSKE